MFSKEERTEITCTHFNGLQFNILILQSISINSGIPTGEFMESSELAIIELRLKVLIVLALICYDARGS